MSLLACPPYLATSLGCSRFFLNLAQNSNRAMLSSVQKELTIEARDEEECVVVRVSDTGPGVTNPDELFEPFHRRTAIKGLGLYVSRAIAHSFHGDLRYTPMESGCCFTLELLPLREWQKVESQYGSSTARH
jgi:two-component system C4-dicarboxylate transport sensor histidine kinase DctB